MEQSEKNQKSRALFLPMLSPNLPATATKEAPSTRSVPAEIFPKGFCIIITKIRTRSIYPACMCFLMI